MKWLKQRIAEYIWDELADLIVPEVEKAMNEAYSRGYLTGEAVALEACKCKMDEIEVGGTDAE